MTRLFICRKIPLFTRRMVLMLSPKPIRWRSPLENWRRWLQNVSSMLSWHWIIATDHWYKSCISPHWPPLTVIRFFNLAARPPAPDADSSGQSIKRRLPREIKQKLAKVARLSVYEHNLDFLYLKDGHFFLSKFYCLLRWPLGVSKC